MINNNVVLYREWHIPFSILHPVSAQDTKISQRAEGLGADIDQGLIQVVIMENGMFINLNKDTYLVISYRKIFFD